MTIDEESRGGSRDERGGREGRVSQVREEKGKEEEMGKESR